MLFVWSLLWKKNQIEEREQKNSHTNHYQQQISIYAKKQSKLNVESVNRNGFSYFTSYCYCLSYNIYIFALGILYFIKIFGYFFFPKYTTSRLSSNSIHFFSSQQCNKIRTKQSEWNQIIWIDVLFFRFFERDTADKAIMLYFIFLL